LIPSRDDEHNGAVRNRPFLLRAVVGLGCGSSEEATAPEPGGADGRWDVDAFERP
jgi:hypothetical protein